MESIAQKKAHARYSKKNRKGQTINFFANNETDMIVYHHWKSQESPKQYIINLILKDIDERKKEGN